MTFKVGDPKPESSGKKLGTLNKKNQEVLDLANELEISPMRIKFLLAAGRYKDLGYSDEEIAQLDAEYRIDTQGKNANDILPYLHGKRKPVDSDGSDASDPITELVNAIRNK